MGAEIFKPYFEEGWYNQLSPYLDSLEFQTIGAHVAIERSKFTVYPETPELVFRIFRECPFNSIKVCILGQDPYHDGSADGLAFSNGRWINGKHPSPSLKFILNEVFRQMSGLEVKAMVPAQKLIDFAAKREPLLINGNPYDLTFWARQGVFLFNTALTVRKGQPLSHAKLWEGFTKHVITTLANRKKEDESREEGLVFLLWGEKAKAYSSLIDDSFATKTKVGFRHTILKSGHPVTVVYGRDSWTGNTHFQDTNDILAKWYGEDARIIW